MSGSGIGLTVTYAKSAPAPAGFAGLSMLDWALIAVVIAAIIVALVVALLRRGRRGSGNTGTAPYPPSQTGNLGQPPPGAELREATEPSSRSGPNPFLGVVPTRHGRKEHGGRVGARRLPGAIPRPPLTGQSRTTSATGFCNKCLDTAHEERVGTTTQARRRRRDSQRSGSTRKLGLRRSLGSRRRG